MLFWWFLQNYR